MACPYCRQPVTLLIPNFPISNTPEARLHEQRLDEYNVSHGRVEPANWIERIRTTPLLIRAIARDFAADPRRLVGILYLSARGLGLLKTLLSGIVYLLSPIDLLPEMYFGALGLIDDIIVFFVVLAILVNVYRAFLVNRGRNR